MSRPTLQDIADQLGISKMTVSRYLRNPQQVSATTGEKIATTMEALGYIPSRVPDMLANAKSRAIGVLLPSISNQVFSELVHGIESVTKPAGYHVLYSHYGYAAQVEEAQIEQLLSFHVDGLILAESVHSERTLRMIHTAAIPVVEVMELPPMPIDLAVGLDHTAAAQAMTEALLARGRRHIAYLAARLDIRTRQREAGYHAALAPLGIEAIVIQTDTPSSFTQGGALLREALRRHPDLDAVFCTNDDIAAGALLAAQALGKKIGDDFGVAGCNALDIGRALSPQLASIVTPREEIGRIAAEHLLGRIAGHHYPEQCINAGFTLFAGGSL